MVMNESVVCAGSLYVVATPIGNLGDITARARAVLAAVDAIAAEDTRVAQDLLRHLAIAAPPLYSVREHNETHAASGIIEQLRAGKAIAYVSDAGTPAVSDPGARLVRAVQEAGLSIVPVPGPSAVTTLLSASGLSSTAFTFYGFLPTGTGPLNESFAQLKDCPHTAVFFESTHRIAQTCARLAAEFPTREIVIGKELTKRFEMIARVPTAQLPAWLAADPQRVKGEFVLALAPDANPTTPPQTEEARKWLAELSKELPPARAAKIVAKMTGVSREALYQHITESAQE